MLSTNAAIKASMTPISCAVLGPGWKGMWGMLAPVGADMIVG